MYIASKKNQIFVTALVSKNVHVTSGEVHFRRFAPVLHGSLETSQGRQAVGDTVSDLLGPGIEFQTYRTDSDVFNNSDHGHHSIFVKKSSTFKIISKLQICNNC